MNRREFIKKSVALAGTLAGSIIFPDNGVTALKTVLDIAI